MKTPKEKAKELVEKFIQVQDNTEFKTTEENYEKCVNLINDLGSAVDSYWKQLAIKSAIKAVDEILESSPSLPILSDSGIYGDDIKLSTEYYNEVKNELNKIL